MLTMKREKSGWPLYTAWFVLSALGFPLAWVVTRGIILLIAKFIGETIQVGGQTRITEDYVSWFVLFPVLGLVIGLAQYLVLRRYLPRMGWWIAATVLGWVLPTWILRLAVSLIPAWTDGASTPTVALLVALVGGLLGLFQWLVLRWRVRKAGWWILASIAGWVLAYLVTGPILSSKLDAVVVSMLPALVTSLALWVLLDWLPRKDSTFSM